MLDLSAARTLEELRRIAFGNRVSLMRCRTVADLEKLPEELQAMVADFEVFDANIPGLRDGKTDKARRVRTESKLKALEMLAKHFKLLVEQVDVNVFDWDKLAARLHGKHGLPMRRPDSHTATVHARRHAGASLNILNFRAFSDCT